jgi:lipid II:glycine glycyltransferase (peptidoglycan interpeptide bridge formation enzyme)
LQKTEPNNLWQSLQWEQLQQALGRTVRVYANYNSNGDIQASALVVIDHTSFGLSTWDIPRGPIVERSDNRWQMAVDSLLKKILADAKKSKALSLTLSPTHDLSSVVCYLPSHRHVYPEATRLLDLTLSTEELLAHMKPKGRYNIKVAERNGVTVRTSTDTTEFAKIAQKTAARDGFKAHSPKYYQTFLQSLPGAFLLYADVPGTTEPIAGLIGVLHGSCGTYYYGASDHNHRAYMAPYALQWHAIQHSKAQGCSQYDFFGVAPEGNLKHPWQQVSEFKAKFGGTVVSYPAEQVLTLRPVAKKVLELKRKLF